MSFKLLVSEGCSLMHQGCTDNLFSSLATHDREDSSSVLNPTITDDDPLWLALLQAGAHFRAVSDDRIFDKIRETPGRSLIIVPFGENASRATELVSSLYSQRIDCPVHITSALPRWTGVLDTVIIVADSLDDPQVVAAADFAKKRAGALVLSLTQEDSRTASFHEYSTVVVPPLTHQFSLLVAHAYSLWRHVSVLTRVFMTLADTNAECSNTFENLAEILDLCAQKIGPYAEEITNPARRLAESTLERNVALVSTNSATAAVTHYLQKQFFIVAGVFVSTADFVSWCRRLMFTPSTHTSTDDIFYDPYVDSLQELPQRAFLFADHGIMVKHLAYAESFGDIHGVFDGTSDPMDSAVEGLDSLLTSLMIAEAAVIYRRTLTV